MSKAKQKQVQKLREYKQKKEQEYKLGLKKLIDNNQSIKISLDYCQQYFQLEIITESLQEYSPTHISRLIYDEELKKIEQQINKLPQKTCKIQHFILILLKALNLPFEKTPLYMVGLKDMFRQIAEESKDVVTYTQIFKYVVGELIISKEDQRNTQFHVQFQERKKQDFLLHDNGIKKFFHSNDLKVVLSLDNNQNMIKIYDSDMRNINRFAARKDMHSGRVPQIIDFDYSELTMRLGIIFSDKTIESVHLPNFINKTQSEFQQTSLNQLLFTLPKVMKNIYYIQMLNKWLTFSDQINQLYLFDMEKVRLKPEEVVQKITIDTNELTISQILEIVPLSLICVVAGNQINFYNQSLSQTKVVKYCHDQIIYKLKYSQQKSTFYLCGNYQKTITMFTINRIKTAFKISNFSINKVITDFEIFPYFETLLICDQNHQLRLIHQPTKTVYKQQSYQHIVKMKQEVIHSYKISKSQFMIYQTYMIGFNQQKIAIQKQMEFNFLPYYYFDPKKDEFYISLNDQIISFSVIFGQIRKNYSIQTSNIHKHQCFFLGSKTRPFILDKSKNLYELYLKTQEIDGQTKQYKKKLLLNDIITYFYDQDMRNFMVVGSQSISQIRNDTNNSFSIINYINLVGFCKINSARFCTKSKMMTLLGSNLEIYQFKNFQNKLSKYFSIHFQRQRNDYVEGIIIDFDYCSDLEILILLNNKNELYVIQRLNTTNYDCIKIADYLPPKLKNTNFNRLNYSLFKQKGASRTYITLTDETGYILEINSQKWFNKKFLNNKIQQKNFKPFLKESYDLIKESIKKQQISLNSSNPFEINQNDFLFQKAHDKQIVITAKLKLEILTTLTISKDGFIKLWNQKFELLSALKLPNLCKNCWNMSQIQSIKNKKSIQQITDIIHNHYSNKNDKIEISSILHKSKKLKNHQQIPRKFKFLEDIPLEIQSKEIEDIILREPNYRKISLTARSYQKKMTCNPQHTTLDSHPWRIRKQFVKIYQRASPPHKYFNRIPSDLMSLRVSLDMSQRKKKQPNYQTAELILPQLKNYETEGNKNRQQKSVKKDKDEEIQTFESCLYIRQQRSKRKRNQLDVIDKQFLQRQIQMHNRRSINRYKQDKPNMTIDLTESTIPEVQQSKKSIFKEIRSVFEQHNKECSQTNKGRIINLSQLNFFKERQ